MPQFGENDPSPNSRINEGPNSEAMSPPPCRILETLSPSVTTHHGARIDAEVEHAVVRRSLSMGEKTENWGPLRQKQLTVHS